MSGAIDVTNCSLVEIIKAAYSLSESRGLGILQSAAGPLTDDEAKAYIRPDGNAYLDYVKGRAVKLNLAMCDGRRLIYADRWFDHSDAQLKQLLAVAISLGGRPV